MHPWARVYFYKDKRAIEDLYNDRVDNIQNDDTCKPAQDHFPLISNSKWQLSQKFMKIPA